MLTIEDGSGIEGADSFADAEELDDVLAAYFAEEREVDEDVKEAALRRAWLFMRSLNWLPALPWPTMGGDIPDDLVLAQCILARQELDAPNGLSPTVTPGKLKVLTRAGEIGWTPSARSGVEAQRAHVMMAMDLLAPYTVQRTVGIPLVRA